MEHLNKTYCRYDMVCDNPSGTGLDILYMPDFFNKESKLETCDKHVHGFYEIIWFQDGEGSHFVDFDEYPVTPGSIFFISPGQVHSFDNRHDQKGIVLKICSELLNSGINCEGAYLRYNVFNAFDHAPYYKVSDNDVRRLTFIIDAMEEEIKQHGSVGHKEYLQSLIKMFIIRVQRNITSENEIFNPSRTSHKNFLAFRRLIENHFHELHKVKEYAELLNLTTKTLTQHVNECTMFSPLELINNRITLEAKRLLCYSNMTVKEISFHLGFEDPSYFVKYFKRETKMTPADYREETL